MAQKDLIPVNMRSKEEAKQISRNGGIKSGIARRRKKTFKDSMILMLESKVSPELKERYEELYPGMLDAVETFQDLITVAANKKASDGEMKALEVLRDTIGEKPREQKQIEHTGEITHKVTQIDLDERINRAKEDVDD